MATLEEKEQLIRTIKNPNRYYRVTITGYGGESAYMTVNEDAYNFWRDHTEQHGDGDLINYMINAEDSNFDFDELEGLPESAEFLKDADGDGCPWYEAPTEFEHTYGVAYDSANIEVSEVADDEYNAEILDTPLEHTDLSELADTIYEESGDDGIEIQQYSCCEDAPGPYVVQMYSTEKGCFFDGVIHVTNGADFDPQKLKIEVMEFLNGEDTVTGIFYDGEEVDNVGGDTNGKGYSASVWAT